jgi:protoheme ferro-lyase
MRQMMAEQEYTHIGETHGAADHDHDLIHELSKRLDAVWRFDQYIANADGKPDIQHFWRELKQQECRNVDRLKELVAHEVEAKCF